MTSRITQDPAKGEKGFPKLMIHKDGTVVMFSSKCEGTCLVPGGSTLMGFHSDAWKVDRFTDFHGTVELRND